MSIAAETPVIAFAGGAHSGKSTTLAGLRGMINSEYRVAFAPEVATEIFSGRPADDVAGENIYYRQTYIVRTQLMLEKLLKESSPDAVIFDRGICDTHTYIPEEDQARLLKYLGMTDDDLNRHYDLVCFFDTIFADPSDDEATLRIENSVEEIRQNADRAYESWKNCTNIVRIPVSPIEERCAAVAALINSVTGKKLFLV